MVLHGGEWGRRGETISSGQWHLGRTGGLSSCLKISILLHPKDLVSLAGRLPWSGSGFKPNTTSGSHRLWGFLLDFRGEVGPLQTSAW